MLHARTDGPTAAPPLVLLNSVGSTTEMWTPLVGPLAEQFRVIRIDHRGHGGSPTPAIESPESLAGLAADVLAVLDDLAVSRAHFAGVSLGGMIGMWLAAHRPERVARLAAICTSAHTGAESEWLTRAATVRQDGMAAIADSVVARWLTADLASRDPGLLERLRDMVAGVDAEGYAQCCKAIAAMDLRPDLPRIAAPTLVVAGAQDPAFAPEHAEFIAASVAGARLEVLDPAAHVPTFERAGRLAALLTAHFGGGATLAGGYATRRAVLGDAHVDRSIAATTPLTADFQQFLTRYAWGDVWSRPGLPRRDRSIATLAALVTLGAENELQMHVRAARRNGLSAEEIAEVVLHTALYAGLPRANRAMALTREVLEGD
jgi:3-oxoadipate enol-lactonase / 4-carboxymuconolactone decarboxylase